ncbi:MAG: hypothetical protein KQH83_00580 [Actinobacteria bacterium]|nr:hypothetical protein [Actinomycetota bacterium]
MPRHRLAYLWLTAALVAVVAAAVLLSPSGDPAGPPAPLEEVFPAPGDQVVRQTVVEVDLPVGYEIALFVDGRRVPPDEIGATPSTGVFVWQPAPGGSMEVWAAGEHTVRVEWDRTEGGRPDPGEYEWSFRVR